MEFSFLQRLLMLSLLVPWQPCDAFHVGNRPITLPRKSETMYINIMDRRVPARPSLPTMLCSGIVPDESDVTEPGTMRVSEIKAELNRRKVSYADCFDKESLVQRLTTARKEGVSDPTIFEASGIDFKQSDLEIAKEAAVQFAKENNGLLPGGLRIDDFQKFVNDPENLSFFSIPKVQENLELLKNGSMSFVRNWKEIEK